MKGRRTGVVAGVAVLGLLAVVVPGVSAGAGTAVPYTDPNAAGYIGLCNQQGQQVSSGSVTTKPFVWRAVSSTPAPAPYSGSSRTAILFAYQPIQGIASEFWSGAQLTASSRYTNPSNPMAAATAGDWSLATYMTEFPPQWDGLLQLRMFLGAAGQTTYSARYPVLDIEVTGDTWRALDGGPVSCSSGTAASIESLLLPASQTQAPGNSPQSSTSSTAVAGTGATSAVTSKPSSGNPPNPSPARSGGADQTPAHAASAVVPSAGGTNAGLLAALVVVLALVLGVLGFVVVRRRRRGPGHDQPGDIALASPVPAVSSTKGTQE